MMTTAFLLMVAALGLTIQFGYAGVVNFAGAAFLGIGCYTAGVVTKYTSLPSFLTLPLGGLMAAVIGSILILPVLRTRGHYAALVTIAFGILFKVFLEVNDTLGGRRASRSSRSSCSAGTSTARSGSAPSPRHSTSPICSLRWPCWC
jgi:ABC-type branched-chain amino acid transport system, permease component